MALRSLGHTLLAKAGTGSQLRSAEEARQQGAVQTGNEGAQPTSASRELVQEPLEVQTPEGTLKKVASQPSIQEKVSLSGNQQNSNELLPGVMGVATGGAALRSKANVPSTAPVGASKSTAPTPNIQPTGFSAPKSESAATPVSGGVNLATQIKNLPNAGLLDPTEITSYAKQGSQIGTPQASPAPKSTAPQALQFNPLGFLGGRVSAAGGQASDFTRNLLQGIAATIGERLNVPELTSYANNPQFSESGGVAKNALQAAGTPSISSSQGTPNIVQQAKWVASKAAPAVASKVSAPLRSATSAITDTFKPANTAAMADNLKAAGSSAVNKVVSFLRSLFK